MDDDVRAGILVQANDSGLGGQIMLPTPGDDDVAAPPPTKLLHDVTAEEASSTGDENSRVRQ
jgi:hypothetical protein